MRNTFVCGRCCIVHAWLGIPRGMSRLLLIATLEAPRLITRGTQIKSTDAGIVSVGCTNNFVDTFNISECQPSCFSRACSSEWKRSKAFHIGENKCKTSTCSAQCVSTHRRRLESSEVFKYKSSIAQRHYLELLGPLRWFVHCPNLMWASLAFA